MSRLFRRRRPASQGGGFFDGWYYEWRDERGRKRMRKAGRSKREAELFESRMRVEVEERRRNPMLRVADGTQLLEEFFEEYLTARAHTLLDIATRRAQLSAWLRHFGSKARLRDVTAESVEAFKAKRLAMGRAAATVNRERAALHAALACAVRWGRVPYNPVTRVRLEPEENRRTRYLTPEEAEALVRAARERSAGTGGGSFNPALASLIILALNTGARLGELLNLKWEHVDIRGRLLTFPRTKARTPRTVPMAPIVERELQRLPRESEWVLTHRGQRLRDPRAAFRSACTRAGLGPDVVFHTLRHTAISRLAEQGVDARVIQRIVGHSSLAMTERYTHVGDESLRRAVEKLALGKPDLHAVKDSGRR